MFNNTLSFDAIWMYISMYTDVHKIIAFQKPSILAITNPFIYIKKY